MIVAFARRRRRTLAGGVGALTLAGMLALPSAAGPDLRAEFARSDANGDGMISFAEFSGGGVPADEVARARESARLDFGKDDPRVVRQSYMVRLPPSDADQEWRLEMGVRLIVHEWDGRDDGRHPVRPPDDPLAYEFVNMDVDSDEVVTFEEWQVHRQKLLTTGFRFLDSDADGWLTVEEFERTRRHGEFMPSNDPERAAPEPVRISDQGLRTSYREMDLNGDERISVSEYLSAEL